MGENSVSINDSVRTKNNRHLSNKTNLRGKESMQPDSTLSNAYIALYEYKPRKSDELELKKGCNCHKSSYYIQRKFHCILYCFDSNLLCERAMPRWVA